MSENFDFIIQIIGAPSSGKTKIAYAIAEILKQYGVKVEHCQIHNKNDFSELDGKNVFITEFQANDDPSIKNS